MVKDILLVFPPLTEARFFPYLSLPMITAYLLQHAINITQKDFNIELCHRLMTPIVLNAYKEKIEKQTQGNLNIPLQVRWEMANFLQEHYESLYGYMFEKDQKKRNKNLHGYELEFNRRGIEMLMEGSILKREVSSLEEISSIVMDFENIQVSDIAAILQYDMLVQLIQDENPRIFALSVAFYSQLLPSLLMAKWVKEKNPKTVIVIGGPQIIQFHSHLLKIPAIQKYIDYLGIGAGEEALLILHKKLTAQSNASNIPDLLCVSDPDTMVTLFVEFSIRCRLEAILLDKEFCEELRQRGCTQVSVGYETNSQRVLNLVDKGVDTKNYQEIIDNLYSLGIEIRLNVMGGLPTETEEEARESLAFLKSNEKKIGIDVIQMLVIEPNSLILEQSQKNSLMIQQEEKQLLGNKALNYGMGRMGYQFSYTEGDDYEQRKQRLLEVLKEVKPILNKEIQKKIITDKYCIKKVKLYPWLKIIEGSLEATGTVERLFLDLMFEKIYLYPEKLITHRDQEIYPREVENQEAIALMEQLVELGFGEAN
ncbi:MAG: radical SAM protein [Paenibacillaceae bacterium]